MFPLCKQIGDIEHIAQTQANTSNQWRIHTKPIAEAAQHKQTNTQPNMHTTKQRKTAIKSNRHVVPEIFASCFFLCVVVGVKIFNQWASHGIVVVWCFRNEAFWLRYHENAALIVYCPAQISIKRIRQFNVTSIDWICCLFSLFHWTNECSHFGCHFWCCAEFSHFYDSFRRSDCCGLFCQHQFYNI